MRYFYARYIITHILLPIIIITGALTGIIWLSQSLRFTSLIIDNGLAIDTFLTITLLLIPSLLMIIMPIALFSAVLYAYNQLTMTSELLVLQSAGLSHAALARPALLIGIVSTLVSYSLTLYGIPTSYCKLKDMQNHFKENYTTLTLQEGVFNTSFKNFTVYVAERSEQGMLKGIFVQDNRNPEKTVSLMASQGKLVNTAAGTYLHLEHGNRQEYNHKNKKVSFLHFEYYPHELSLYTPKPTKRWKEPEERYVSELFADEKERPEMNGKLHAEGHQRLIWPLYNILLTEIGVLALLRGEFNRRGQWRRMATATVGALGSIFIAFTLINLTASYPILAPLNYLFLGGLLIMCSYACIREQSRSISFLPS